MMNRKEKSRKLNTDFILTNPKTPFSVVEAYKEVMTNIVYSSTLSKKNKTIIITSPQKAEGKSTFALNLSICFSQNDYKVLLIDADLRKSMVHRLLRLNNTQGLADIIVGFSDCESTIFSEYIHNLSVLTAGARIPNPLRLLSSNEMKNLVKEMEKEYDYIIIDTPPINVVQDAVTLMDDGTGTILVAKYGSTEKEDLSKAAQKIKNRDTAPLGIVITQCKSMLNKKYKYSYKYNY